MYTVRRPLIKVNVHHLKGNVQCVDTRGMNYTRTYVLVATIVMLELGFIALAYTYARACM